MMFSLDVSPRPLNDYGYRTYPFSFSSETARVRGHLMFMVPQGKPGHSNTDMEHICRQARTAVASFFTKQPSDLAADEAYTDMHRRLGDFGLIDVRLDSVLADAA